MQELWRLKLDWNDSLSIQLESQWKRFVTFLSTINTLNIPRYILLDYALKIELHGFADATEKAYGAAIYVRCLSNSGEISTNLLCSKSRIAPLKSITIPRLELCAAVLLAKLAQKTITSMKISFHSTVLWTDSTIVLAWIQKDPSVLKPFVRNRSVHLEIVNSCSTDAFIGALKRFIARRGKPSDIYSDNGTNFVGANNELRKILKDLFNKESTGKIEDFIASEGIVWHFNPPATPYFGGLWEAGVKSLKSHLKRVVGNTVLTHEEFSTLVIQVEAVLNSRPLCNLSSDPNDDFVLTPAHFLVGSSLTLYQIQI
ncbi:hypothetical protein AVEN_179245-1 [Araneus ventricosus]|uniref:Integrase catalytic domain-containing protein n=1 Tax=Araneus ventricosus TaxID=182803 RepID=A0A4Y2C8E6_ARAVE|nr:hypothetical protein AVEN_179245-1 [Araneus ventricosus]